VGGPRGCARAGGVMSDWVTFASVNERIQSVISRSDGLGAAHHPPLTAECDSQESLGVM
jgi:hypothetical protein